jgi:hypothetical protein
VSPVFPLTSSCSGMMRVFPGTMSFVLGAFGNQYVTSKLGAMPKEPFQNHCRIRLMDSV